MKKALCLTLLVGASFTACVLAQAAGPSATIRAMQLPGEPCGKNHYILDDPIDCLWVLTGELNVARARHTATLLPDGRVLVAGGTDDLAKSAEIYDPHTGRWSLTGAMNRNRMGHTATLLPDGRVLVVGGDPPSSSATDPFLEPEIFDPASGTWTFTAGLITARDSFSATLLDSGKVLVAGGFARNASLASCELYDPRTGAWEATGERNATYGQTATLLRDGSVLTAGGVADDFLGYPVDIAERYDVRTGTWERTGSMVLARMDYVATLLADGSVLATGGWYRECDGWCTFFALSWAERFDPSTGTWRRAGDSAPRYDHTATLLGDGSVLVAGGIISLGAVPHLQYWTLSSAEIFSPDDNGWEDTAVLNVPRFGHTATLLADGSVLVAGGSVQYGANFTASPLKSAEIYRPAVARPR